jgi:uncharacterized protein (TIGR03435 family)
MMILGVILPSLSSIGQTRTQLAGVPMIAKILLPLLAFVVPNAFGQIGLYGAVTIRLKAGDLAPDIRFTKVLSSPTGAEWRAENLTGQLTILIFYLNTSRNLQTITMWNSLVDTFAGKGVQFLFISGEKDSTLMPWLSVHPIKGWVFHDPDGQTGKAYGLDQPETVFIGADGKILGFGNMGFPPSEQEVNAARKGQITTTRPTRLTMEAFLKSGKVLLNAEPQRMPHPDEHKPDLPPSYTLHVSPSRGEDRGDFSGDDFRVLRDHTLKEAIQSLYQVNPIRVYLPASLEDGTRYDFALVLPEREGWEKMNDRFKQGLQDHFHFAARRENRLVDVYVVTTVANHEPPALPRRVHEKMGGFGMVSTVGFETAGGLDQPLGGIRPLNIDAIRSVFFNGTTDELCYMLDGQLDRPVVNETNLEGEFDFRVESTKGPANDFLEHLRDQLGLVITQSQRNIEVLVIEFN